MPGNRLRIVAALLCLLTLGASAAQAQSADTGTLGGHHRFERRRAARRQRHRHQQVDRRLPAGDQRRGRRLRAALSHARRLHRGGVAPGLPVRTAGHHAAHRTDGPARLRAAGRQRRRGDRRRRQRPAPRNPERRHRRRGHGRPHRQPAAERAELRQPGEPHRRRGRLGRLVRRQRRAHAVSADLVRRRLGDQQPRQCPDDVPVGGRGGGIQGPVEQLHGGIRRPRRRERPGAAQVGREPVPRRGVRLHPQRPLRRPQLLHAGAAAKADAGSQPVRGRAGRSDRAREDVLHGLVSGAARDARDGGPGQHADRRDAQRRLLGGVDADHRSADRPAVPGQHHPARPSRSGLGRHGQSVSAAAEPVGREQLQRRDASPRTPRTSS